MKLNLVSENLDGADLRTVMRHFGVSGADRNAEGLGPPTPPSGSARNLCLVGHGIDSDINMLWSSGTNINILHPNMGITSAIDTVEITKDVVDYEVANGKLDKIFKPPGEKPQGDLYMGRGWISPMPFHHPVHDVHYAFAAITYMALHQLEFLPGSPVTNWSFQPYGNTIYVGLDLEFNPKEIKEMAVGLLDIQDLRASGIIPGQREFLYPFILSCSLTELDGANILRSVKYLHWRHEDKSLWGRKKSPALLNLPTSMVRSFSYRTDDYLRAQLRLLLVSLKDHVGTLRTFDFSPFRSEPLPDTPASTSSRPLPGPPAPTSSRPLPGTPAPTSSRPLPGTPTNSTTTLGLGLNLTVFLTFPSILLGLNRTDFPTPPSTSREPNRTAFLTRLFEHLTSRNLCVVEDGSGLGRQHTTHSLIQSETVHLGVVQVNIGQGQDRQPSTTYNVIHSGIGLLGVGSGRGRHFTTLNLLHSGIGLLGVGSGRGRHLTTLNLLHSGAILHHVVQGESDPGRLPSTCNLRHSGTGLHHVALLLPFQVRLLSRPPIFKEPVVIRQGAIR
ncbi:hypothetical protein J4E80_008887 [Alternaria sp. BMP 0032]|nr:hypothetical protein J4E80_008887 [Alternaria sp. BMP 0032]